MKNLKSMAVGFVAGALCMVSASVFADDYPEVTVKFFNDVFVKVDGEYKKAPDDQPILNHNGYAYVPLRFVSETLGATIDFDIPSRTINIQSDKKTYVKEVEVEKIVYVDKDDENYDKVEKKKSYSELPIRSRKNDHILELIAVSRDDGLKYTKVILSLENQNNSGCQLIPSQCKLTIDGETVAPYSVKRLWDDKWSLKDLQYDDEMEGFLLFELIDEDWKNGTLEVTVLNNEEGIDEVHTFDFSR
ncbi:MAG: hypothetical protein HFE62_05945 [Firmicutes bacterium]|nr:hypothetical protein [Bacillota bacterium]